MFQKIKSFRNSPFLNKDALLRIKNELEKAEFSDIQIKLPYNFLQKIEEHQLSLEEYLNRNRNYAAIILEARRSNDEVIKMLFINRNVESNFYDDTFPSGHSVSPKIWVKSNDPVRMLGLVEYYTGFMNEMYVKKREWVSAILFFLSITFLMFEFGAILDSKNSFLAGRYGLNALIDVLGIVLSLILIYRYFNTQRGVYVKERSKSVSNYLDLIIRGELKDNPLVVFIISVSGSLLVALIMKLLEWIGSSN